MVLLYTASSALATPLSTPPTKNHAAAPPSVTYGPGVASKRPGASPLQDWYCTAAAFGGQVSGTSMWGQGLNNCTADMETVDMIMYADYCQPMMLGCSWQQMGEMGSATYQSVPANSTVWIPSYGSLTWSNGIQPGELWRMRVNVCAYDYVGRYACTDVEQNVQF